jgi:hypothetical protein
MIETVSGETQTAAVHIDERTRALVQMLTEAFGSGWTVLNDGRYDAELAPTRTLPIEVVLPLEEHPAAVQRAMEVEIRMLNEFNSTIAIFVRAPESEQ